MLMVALGLDSSLFNVQLIIIPQKAHVQKRSDAILLNRRRKCYPDPDLDLNGGMEAKWQ